MAASRVLLTFFLYMRTSYEVHVTRTVTSHSQQQCLTSNKLAEESAIISVHESDNNHNMVVTKLQLNSLMINISVPLNVQSFRWLHCASGLGHVSAT